MPEAIDQRLCETVCRHASVRGWGAKLVEERPGSFRATFRGPDGLQVRGVRKPTQAEALTQACHAALPHLAG